VLLFYQNVFFDVLKSSGKLHKKAQKAPKNDKNAHFLHFFRQKIWWNEKNVVILHRSIT